MRMLRGCLTLIVVLFVLCLFAELVTWVVLWFELVLCLELFALLLGLLELTYGGFVGFVVCVGFS